jgi:hypothetical protein
MSRLKRLLLFGVIAVASLAATAPAASAQPPPNASCVGVLSSFTGQAHIRSQFAPLPGQLVASVAQQHGDFAFCSGLIGM